MTEKDIYELWTDEAFLRYYLWCCTNQVCMVCEKKIPYGDDDQQIKMMYYLLCQEHLWIPEWTPELNYTLSGTFDPNYEPWKTKKHSDLS